MSTPEERLAALLHSAEVPLRGDGLQRIQAKLARRRRTRWVVPVAALATTGVAASVIVLAGGADRDTLTVQPGDTPAATAEPSSTAVPCAASVPPGAPCPTGSPAPSPDARSVGDSYDGPFIWPAQQMSLDVQAWRSDPQQVAQHFVTDFLHLDGVAAVGLFPARRTEAGQFELRVHNTAVASLTLAQTGDEWVVVRAEGTGGQINQPGFGESVTSPLDVSGTLDQAVDDNVRLTLLTRAGKEVAQTSAPAGSAVPWSGTLTWSDTSWTAGAVVGVTRSNKDGAVTRVFAQPVVRATGAEVATFVGIVDGHVSTFATDGSEGRRLTYPPSGSRDVEASFNGTSALVHRDTPNRGTCGDSLIRIDGTSASTVATGGHLFSPRLSPSGTWEAWGTSPCMGGATSVALHEADKPVRFLSVPSGTTVVGVDSVRDDGSLLLQVSTTSSSVERLLTRSDTSVTAGKALPAGKDCQVSAPAFDGPRIVAWEACGSTVHLVRYDGNGARVSTDPAVPLSEAPQRTSVNSGQVLVWLFGGDTVGEIARYQHGKLATVVRNTGCTSVSEPKGCVRDPSW